MKYFIALSALIVAASALPADFTSLNATRDGGRSFGFASFGGHTTGGQNGGVWTVWDAWAFRDAINNNDRRIVIVRGRIDLTALFTGSPGVVLQVGSYKTIEGGDWNAEIFGGGVKLYERQQVIFRNLRFTNAINYAPGEQPNGNGGIVSMVPGAFSSFDNIDIDDSHHVWVSHNHFSDDPWVAHNTPDSQRRHHGLLGIKRGANYITVSDNIFRNHNLCMVVGHDDSNAWQDNGRLKITFSGNWFQGTIQRNPRIRFGEIHIYNNLFTDISDYGIGIGVGARILAERNVFLRVHRAWALMAVNQNPIGMLSASENSLQSSTVDSGITSSIGWHPTQYYGYSTIQTNGVEAFVRNTAGVRL